MRKELTRFFIGASIISAVTITCSQIFFSCLYAAYDFPGRIAGIVFIGSVTCLSHYWLMKTVTGKPKVFGRVFMVQTVGKLLLYLLCILGYLMLFGRHAAPFTFQFLVVYVIFAVFEVLSILKFVKNNSGQTPGNTKISN